MTQIICGAFDEDPTWSWAFPDPSRRRQQYAVSWEFLDPALDYAWLLSGPFADWDVDSDLRRRARFCHRLAPWYEAHYGLFTNQPARTERGLAEIYERL